MKYLGVQQQVSRALARKAEIASRQRDETANPGSMSDTEIVVAVYRLQGRNRGGSWSERIRSLVAEQARRR